MLKALIAFMPTKAKGIGSLDYPPDIRKKMAMESIKWKCVICGAKNWEVLVSKKF